MRVVRCWQPVYATVWEAAVTGEPVPSIAAQQVRSERELAQIVAAALGQSPAAALGSVARGLAGRVLVAVAAGAALLVVGSHGHRRIHDLLAESTTPYCAARDVPRSWSFPRPWPPAGHSPR
ncbi:MAG: hypothetical protein QOI89_3522 [Solirubrobacteraceae bacterium]|nr:hypothetical protein [Solirubrobacteraceae bacterium]